MQTRTQQYHREGCLDPRFDHSLGSSVALLSQKVNQFLRLARDCQIVNGGDTASNGGLRAAEANLAFASVIQGRTKVSAEGTVVSC